MEELSELLKKLEGDNPIPFSVRTGLNSFVLLVDTTHNPKKAAARTAELIVNELEQYTEISIRGIVRATAWLPKNPHAEIDRVAPAHEHTINTYIQIALEFQKRLRSIDFPELLAKARRHEDARKESYRSFQEKKNVDFFLQENRDFLTSEDARLNPEWLEKQSGKFDWDLGAILCVLAHPNVDWESRIEYATRAEIITAAGRAFRALRPLALEASRKNNFDPEELRPIIPIFTYGYPPPSEMSPEEIRAMLAEVSEVILPEERARLPAALKYLNEHPEFELREIPPYSLTYEPPHEERLRRYLAMAAKAILAAPGG